MAGRTGGTQLQNMRGECFIERAPGITPTFVKVGSHQPPRGGIMQVPPCRTSPACSPIVGTESAMPTQPSTLNCKSLKP